MNKTMSQNLAQSTPMRSIRVILKAVPTLIVLAIMGAGWFAVHEINTGGQSETAEEAAAVGEEAPGNTITLPAGKLAAAEFDSEPIQKRSIQQADTIPGRIRYDETKHIEVKAPMDGILSEILVQPGDHVEAGRLLAVVSSPEIGQARAEILKRQKEREIAKQQLERTSALATNLRDLDAMLLQGQPVDFVENAFSHRDLGVYREGILSSYAKMQLSAAQLEKIKPLAETGAVAGKVVREREADRQLAETSYRTARDQASFATKQAKLQGEAELAEAERQVKLAWQALDSMLGYKENKGEVDLASEESLSRLEIRAPFAGSVESRRFANNERVAQGDAVLVLANTESLYVSASIREADWSAVALQEGTPVSVMVPALQDQIFGANIRYVGREVEAETNSVPLIATIKNDQSLFRPGMFVRVTVPVGKPLNVLCVKLVSVVQHEDQQFVFEDLSDGKFRRIDVATGQVNEDWVEITKGLSPGQLIVTEGAFLLKSELLLQGESE